MDNADLADYFEQCFTDARIEQIRQQSTRSSSAPKACLNCQEPFEPQFLCLIPRRWCDADCQADYMKRNEHEV